MILWIRHKFIRLVAKECSDRRLQPGWSFRQLPSFCIHISGIIVMDIKCLKPKVRYLSCRSFIAQKKTEATDMFPDIFYKFLYWRSKVMGSLHVRLWEESCAFMLCNIWYYAVVLIVVNVIFLKPNLVLKFIGGLFYKWFSFCYLNFFELFKQSWFVYKFLYTNVD